MPPNEPLGMTPEREAERCWICFKLKGQPPERCNGHYAVAGLSGPEVIQQARVALIDELSDLRAQLATQSEEIEGLKKERDEIINKTACEAAGKCELVLTEIVAKSERLEAESAAILEKFEPCGFKLNLTFQCGHARTYHTKEGWGGHHDFVPTFPSTAGTDLLARLQAAEKRLEIVEADRSRESDSSMEVLCGDHAQTWYTARNILNPKSGCVWCDVANERAEQERDMRTLVEALRGALPWAISGGASKEREAAVIAIRAALALPSVQRLMKGE